MSHPQFVPGPQAYHRHPRDMRRRVLFPVWGLVLLAVLGLLGYALSVATYGLVEVLVATALVLLAIPLVVACFLWLDRWEPEPPMLLLGAFLWGACFATLVAGFGNAIGGAVVCPADPELGCTAVFVAPVVEESLKGIFLLGLVVFRRREFDGVLDGIVYAGLVGAGFALTEDIDYLASAFASDGAGALVGTFIVRELFTPFGHSLFTMMTGIGLGIAVNARSLLGRVMAPIVGFGLAVALHATFNAGFGMTGITLGFVAVFFVAVGVVVYQRKREQRVIAAELPGMAQAGWIAPSEVPLLQSLAGRQGWRRHVQQRLGKPGAQAIHAYQVAVTELAILRHRMARGAVGPQAGHWHDELLHDVHAARAAATRRPDALQAAWGRRPPPPQWAPPPPGWQPAPGGYTAFPAAPPGEPAGP